MKLAPQRLEKRIIRTHDDAALRTVLSYRPKTFAHWRIHALVVTILDTGCRIDELLTARVRDFDFDNLLLTVLGKGRKERRVPTSIELRKVAMGSVRSRDGEEIESELMFPTRECGLWHQRNALRSYYCSAQTPRDTQERLSSAAAYVRNAIFAARRGKLCVCRLSSGTPKCRPR